MVKVVPGDRDRYKYFCEGCGKDLGEIDKGEALALLSQRYGVTLCFDCDKLSADVIPDALRSPYVPYLLKIGKGWYLVDPWGEAGEALVGFCKLLNDAQEAWDKGVRPVGVRWVEAV